jgi:hypothetical protein
LLPADIDPDTAPPGAGVALGTAPLCADILEPKDGATVRAGELICTANPMPATVAGSPGSTSQSTTE